MKITMEERCRGEYLPPWYYGYSYYQFDKMVGIYHIIPFNYLIRIFRILNHWWCGFRSKPSKFDILIFEYERKINILKNDIDKYKVKVFKSKEEIDRRVNSMRASIEKDIWKQIEKNLDQYLKENKDK
jgi:hypothetical protein